ncbi:MAG: S-layer homology domain-containing protein, partial [Firmicutes bacterium]|nr:S-layer homology domain-containing protein [Bacillota bacterium]
LMNALTDSEVADLLARFGDAKDIQSWAKANAAIAIKAGIIRGRSAAEFAPKTNATRAEGVTMLKRVLSYLGEL